MLKIIKEDDSPIIWDEKGTPPSSVYLEDSKGQCIAQVLCSNAEEQDSMSRLLSASTDMKKILEDIVPMDNQGSIESIKLKIKPLLNYIKGE